LQDKELSAASGYLIQEEKETVRYSTLLEGTALINKTLHHGSVQKHPSLCHFLDTYMREVIFCKLKYIKPRHRTQIYAVLFYTDNLFQTNYAKHPTTIGDILKRSENVMFSDYCLTDLYELKVNKWWEDASNREEWA
jgi:hypothetical protein